MDKIISFVNKHNTKNITLLYSTPSSYLDALKKDNVKWDVKYDDGFPYSDNEGEYWSGFYSSRPTKKKQIRDFSAAMHASEKIFAKKVLSSGADSAEVENILKHK